MHNPKLSYLSNKLFLRLSRFVHLNNKAINISIDAESFLVVSESDFANITSTTQGGAIYVGGQVSSVHTKSCASKCMANGPDKENNFGTYICQVSKSDKIILHSSFFSCGDNEVGEATAYYLYGQNIFSTSNVSYCVAVRNVGLRMNFGNIQTCNYSSFIRNSCSPLHVIACFESADSELKRCNFFDNSQLSAERGIIYCYMSNLSVIESIIQNNTKNAPTFCVNSNKGNLMTVRNCFVDHLANLQKNIITNDIVNVDFENYLKHINSEICANAVSVALLIRKKYERSECICHIYSKFISLYIISIMITF